MLQSLIEFVSLQGKVIIMIKDIIYAIEDLFVNYLFYPFDFNRSLELENWWLSNAFSWIFVAIFAVCFTYWMLQLKSYDDKDEEDKSVSAHSFL